MEEVMPDNPSFIITVVKRGDEFFADLLAQSKGEAVADLRLRGVGPSVRDAVEICLTELESKAADGDDTALRFA